MKKTILLLSFLTMIFSSCGDSAGEKADEGSNKSEPVAEKPELVKPEGQPDRVVVQHILIAFKGKIPSASRSQQEAMELADVIYQKASKGDDYDSLVKKYTDDSFPGKYAMVNFGVVSENPDDMPREALIPSFGEVGFALEVGELGLAPFDSLLSPYGWHIIKRVE